jgi:hypothetical protein
LRSGRLTSLALVVGCLICISSAWATPITEPTVQISQNGHTFEDLTLLTSASPAYRYYRYHHSTGHPAFGVAKETATISLYWDTATGSLSLMFISGGDDSGKGNVTVTGLPRTSSLVLSDDPGEFSYSPKKGKVTGNFQYGGSTDGFVLAMPDVTTFTADLKLTPKRGIDALRITDGNPTSGGSFIKLNLKEPVYVRMIPAAQSQGGDGSQGGGDSGSSGGSGSGVGTPVPEPTTLGIFALAIPLMLRRRPRR